MKKQVTHKQPPDTYGEDGGIADGPPNPFCLTKAAPLPEPSTYIAPKITGS